MVFMLLKTPHPVPFGMFAWVLISTLLYPYSRFVYESVVGFVMGGNVFILNAFVMLFAKAVTILLCWTLAIFIAPIGLLYLYFR